jgi:hypothetical protein
LVYADDVNMLAGSIPTIKKKTEALVVDWTHSSYKGKNADKTCTWSYLEMRMQDEVTI